MRGQAQDQQRIKDQLGRVRDQLNEVGKKAPILGPGQEQMLQQAQDGMGQAEHRLTRGEPRGAQAGEQQALEKLQQFEDAMEQLAKKSAQGSSGGGLPMPWGEPSGEGDEEGESDSVRHDHVDIPDAESSRAPAEFRKELLAPINQAPPQNYQERLNQHYQDLTK